MGKRSITLAFTASLILGQDVLAGSASGPPGPGVTAKIAEMNTAMVNAGFPMSASGTILGVSVSASHPAAGPNTKGYGGAELKGSPLDVIQILVLGAAWLEGLDPDDFAHVLEYVAVVVHEKHHVDSWTWRLESCQEMAGEDAAALQSCVECYIGLDNCMKKYDTDRRMNDDDPDNDDDPQSDNIEESRANYAAFLCFCKKACDEPDPAKRDGLLDMANALLDKAIEQFANGTADFQNCASSEDLENCDFSQYPMSPLDTDADPPEPFSGPAPGVSECDCNAEPSTPDYDPCAGSQ